MTVHEPNSCSQAEHRKMEGLPPTSSVFLSSSHQSPPLMFQSINLIAQIIKYYLCSKRMLRKIGILRYEHHPGDLHGGHPQPRECFSREQRHQLVGYSLHHPSPRGLCSRFLPQPILDHRQFHDCLHPCKNATLALFHVTIMIFLQEL